MGSERQVKVLSRLLLLPTRGSFLFELLPPPTKHPSTGKKALESKKKGGGKMMENEKRPPKGYFLRVGKRQLAEGELLRNQHLP